jgi:peroxiredoxin
MALQPGDAAPDFTLAAVVDDKVIEASLASLLDGHHGLVLHSYPLDFTGGCTNQMAQFRDAYNEFRKANVEVASISVDSPYSHLAWARQTGIQFPMLSDFARTLLPQLGALGPGSPLLPSTARRTAFVIDPARTICYVWYAPPEGGLPPVGEVLAAAQRVALPD